MSTEPALEVISVERIDGTEIIVEFSDATCATFTPEELTRIRPQRKPIASSLFDGDGGGHSDV